MQEYTNYFDCGNQKKLLLANHLSSGRQVERVEISLWNLKCNFGVRFVDALRFILPKTKHTVPDVDARSVGRVHLIRPHIDDTRR